MTNEEPCENCISRQATIDALWKALFEYEDKTEKQFLESEELDVYDWFQHRIFVQNMSDIDRQTILNMPSVTPKYTEAKIQKIQEMEQAEIEKAYELGKAEQQKTGHWEKVNTAREYNSDAYECSECKYIIWTYKDADRKWNYCPSCGCRMIESEMEE